MLQDATLPLEAHCTLVETQTVLNTTLEGWSNFQTSSNLASYQGLPAHSFFRSRGKKKHAFCHGCKKSGEGRPWYEASSNQGFIGFFGCM